MSADLRRSFKQKAKQAFELPSRLRKGLTDHLDGSDDEHRPMSFDFGCLLQDDRNRIFALQSVPPNKESETGTKTRQRVPLQPSGTIKYQQHDVANINYIDRFSQNEGTINRLLEKVTGRDTLRSLAAHHGTTSSELKTLNKLHSETIFEGQTLYIPDDSYSSCQPEERTESVDSNYDISTKQASPSLLGTGMETRQSTTTVTVPEFENKQLEVELLPYKPLQRLIYGGQDLLFTGIKPILSVTKHIATDNLQKISSSSTEDSTESSFQFIKVPAKYINDKNMLSSVSGLLLLSSDFIMFDPDPCDVQVKEGSIEDFSIILPITSLGSITLTKNAESLLNDRIIIKETGEELAKKLEHISDQLKHNEEGKEPQIVDVFEKAEISKQNLNILQMDSVEEGVIITIKKRSCSETSDEMRRGRMEDDKDPEVLAAALDQKVFEKKRSTSMRKERPLSIVGNLFRFGGLESSSSEVSSPTLASGNKSSLGGGGSTSVENITISSPNGSKLVSRTLSSLSSYSSSLIDDFSSHLFSSTSSTPKLQAISASPSSPTPSPSSSDHQGDRAFFLKPIDVLTKKVKGQLSSSVESTGDEEDKDGDLFLQFKIIPANQSKNSSDLKSDYLFAVQQEKTAMLFTFFLYWNPSSQESQSCFDEPWFVLADRSSDEQREGFASGNVEQIEQRKKSKEWKIVSLQELKRALRISEIEKLPLPELLHESHILENLMVKQLTFHLPPRAEGCKWDLLYSTEIHGFSLKTLFRKVENNEGPTMVLVKDDKSQVFGAMLSCTMKPCDTFYGNGECYLFSFYEKFRKFGWSSLNNYFIYTPFGSISIGSGEGSVGLWLDGDLYYGRTQRCPTFRNDILTENEDFIVRCLEVWRFV